MIKKNLLSISTYILVVLLFICLMTVLFACDKGKGVNNSNTNAGDNNSTVVSPGEEEDNGNNEDNGDGIEATLSIFDYTTIGEEVIINGLKEEYKDATEVVIPDGVTGIGVAAFYGCNKLAEISIPDSVTHIGYSAFVDTAWYNKQPIGLVYAGKVAYRYKGVMAENTDITLMEGTTGIADYAFYNCAGMTSITIPSSVKSIGNNALAYCTGLTGIAIPGSVKSYN